jgi:hypothetical protein
MPMSWPRTWDRSVPTSPFSRRLAAKRVIAFYEPDGGHCGLNVVVWNLTDESGDSAARIRVNLNARQMVNIDSADNKSLNLQCGDHAETLEIVDPSSTMIAAGAAQ